MALIQRFLKAFFQKLYTSMAWAYDLIAWGSSMGQWRTWQHAAVETLSPGRVLEIGFGTGHLLRELRSAGYSMVGIDPSKEMLSIAKRRLGDQGDSVPLIRGVAENLPLRDMQFDHVLATFPSEYIFDPRTLREAYRVLKNGGQFIVVPGVAKITGPRDGTKGLLYILDRFASWLYRLTGEQVGEDEPWQDQVMQDFSEIGFSTKIEFVQQPRAVVLRITAIKN